MTEHATNRPRGAEEQDDPAMSTADLGARLGMTAILRAEAERLIAQPPAPSPTPTPATPPTTPPPGEHPPPDPGTDPGTGPGQEPGGPPPPPPDPCAQPDPPDTCTPDPGQGDPS